MDFQSSKSLSLDSASLGRSKLNSDEVIFDDSDAKSEIGAQAASLEASPNQVGSELQIDDEAASPGKKAAGFIEDLQFKFTQKSKELQVWKCNGAASFPVGN